MPYAICTCVTKRPESPCLHDVIKECSLGCNKESGSSHQFEITERKNEFLEKFLTSTFSEDIEMVWVSLNKNVCHLSLISSKNIHIINSLLNGSSLSDNIFLCLALLRKSSFDHYQWSIFQSSLLHIYML